MFCEKLRLEGPYLTPSAPVFVAARVLCLVGGTGVTGALSLGRAWLRHRADETHALFRLVWTVRTAEAARLAEVEGAYPHTTVRAARTDVMCLQSFRPLHVPAPQTCP